MLSGDPLDPITIPPGENPPEIPFADVSGLVTPLDGDSPLMVVDDGDFYLHFAEQIALLRARDQFVVAIDPGAVMNDVIAALTGTSGALEDYTILDTFDSDRILLSRPQAVEFSAIDLNDVENTTGVEWVSPTFLGADSGAPVYLSEEIAVALQPGVDPSEFFNAEFSSWRRLVNNQYIATLAEGGGLAALSLANQLTTDPDVEWSAPNFDTEFRIAAIPNDPLFTDQWSLENTGQNNALTGADAGLEEAWDITTGSSDIVVAVLDNGVQIDHPDFNIFTNAGEIAGNGIDDDGNGFIDDVNGWDFVGDDVNQPLGAVPDNDPNPFSVDDNHGTAVAGIAAAIGNNGVGVAGAIQNAQILPVKISRDPGNGGGFLQPDEIAIAVYYAAGAVLDANNMVTGSWRGADILVNSWGGGLANPVLTAAFDWAATQGRDGRGVTSFNATGNFADGTVPALKYQPIQIPVTPGQKQYAWSYQTNGDATFLGENRAWIADISLPDGTQELLDADNVLAAGWTSPSAQAWTIADDPAHSFGTARFVARAGLLTQPNQQSNLVSPVINVPAASTLQFSRYVSSQLQFDQFGNPVSDSLVLFESTNGGTFAAVWADAGNPFPIRPVSYPANIASTIAVGASTDWDYRAAYSQYGGAIDIVAPSDGGYASITTTDRTGTDGYSSTDYTSTFTGTSAATPLAAGVAALMLSVNTDLTTAQIRTILRSTADKIGGNNGLTAYATNGFNQFYGFGRVNANTALDTTLSTLGDYDRDQDVDGADFLAWQRGFGSTSTPVGSGADGDLSGTVGSEDLSVWESNFGETIPASLAAASSDTASTSRVDTSSPPEEPLVEESLTEEFSTQASDLAFDDIVRSLPNNFLFMNLQNVTRDLGAELASIRSDSFDNAIASRRILDLAPHDLPFNRTSEEQESYFPELSSRDDIGENEYGVLDETMKSLDASLLGQLI